MCAFYRVSECVKAQVDIIVLWLKTKKGDGQVERPKQGKTVSDNSQWRNLLLAFSAWYFFIRASDTGPMRCFQGEFSGCAVQSYLLRLLPRREIEKKQKGPR